MSDFDLVTPEQLDGLRQLIRSGVDPIMCELLAVRWPDNTVQYGYAQFDRMPNFREGLAAREITVDVRKTSGYFLDLQLRSEIDDDTVPVELLDHDLAITNLLQTHSTGHQVEIYYYFPQIDAYVSVWNGHLRPPQEGGTPILRCSASSGFRNVNVPLPRRVLFTGTCQAIWGGHLKTLAEIAENDCPWNLHLGGDVGVPGSELLPPCSRDSRTTCAQYLGDSLSFLAADTVIESIVNSQTHGQQLLATSQGNETNLKDPLRVHIGERWVRELYPSAYTKQLNNNHPDQGYVRVLVPVGEGPYKSITQCSINDVLIGFEHLNVRLGALRQSPTGFSPNVSNMSGTGHFFGVWGQVNPASYNASNLRGKCKVEGLNNIRVYTDAETFTRQYTQSRAWALLEMETNWRWGRGKKFSRYVISDWIYLDQWGAQTVGYRLADGTEQTVQRTSYNAELIGRAGGEQIKDVCLYGRYGLPFRHNGQVRCVPLQKEDIDDPNIPVFTDEGPNPNIVITNEGSQLFWSQIDLAELTNEIVLTFEDAAHDNVERPMTFSDQPAQVRAAEAMGDTGVHVVQKRYSASGAGGITNEGEAIRWGWMLLNLGEFDSGGIRSNLKVRFLTNVFETLNLRRYQIIKVVSSKIAGFKQKDGQSFQYFRVEDRQRKSDLYAEVRATAYAADYYAEMENVIETPMLPAGYVTANPGGRGEQLPYPIGFKSIDTYADRFELLLNAA